MKISRWRHRCQGHPGFPPDPEEKHRDPGESARKFQSLTSGERIFTSHNYHYHNITIITISPYHHNITTITISPPSQYRHYHNQNYHNITTITKALFSHLPLSLFQGGLARKLRFQIFSFHFLREVLHEMLCFAGQNVSRKMDGEACPVGGCGTRSFVPGSFSDRPRSGTDSSGIVLQAFLRAVLLCLVTQSLQIAL